jgi:hypothetical protein
MLWELVLKVGLWMIERFLARNSAKNASQKQFYELVRALEKDSLISSKLKKSYDAQYEDLMKE